jgi:Fe-S-cluster containining protein
MKHRLPIIELLENTDSFVEDSIGQLNRRGDSVSCQKGCAHCCHLLIEVTWEEAENLAFWMLQQPQPQRQIFIDKTKAAATARKRFFRHSGKGRFLQQPTRSSKDTPDPVAHKFFYGKMKRACPFLENSVCQAYSVRPTACRLHMVTTPPEHCSRSTKYVGSIKVPREAEQARNKVVSILEDQDVDGRWGEMAIMIDAVLQDVENKAATSSATASPKAA